MKSSNRTSLSLVSSLVLAFALHGCATTAPRPEEAPAHKVATSELSAEELLAAGVDALEHHADAGVPAARLARQA